MREKPANYGVWWDANQLDLEWYRKIFESRRPIHEYFQRWVMRIAETEGPFTSVLEVGCGRGVAYPDFFSEAEYTSYDLSCKEIAWCREHRARPKHVFMQGDFIVEAERPAMRSDLVFSHAVIDHVYDIEAFVEACVRSASRWVYLSAYRGWRPSLGEHQYLWDPQSTCFYNDVSPDRLRQQLASLGCTDVNVHALATGRVDIPLETTIVARAPQG